VQTVSASKPKRDAGLDAYVRPGGGGWFSDSGGLELNLLKFFTATAMKIPPTIMDKIERPGTPAASVATPHRVMNRPSRPSATNNTDATTLPAGVIMARIVPRRPRAWTPAIERYMVDRAVAVARQEATSRQGQPFAAQRRARASD
jgi:hypothetical protein